MMQFPVPFDNILNFQKVTISKEMVNPVSKLFVKQLIPHVLSLKFINVYLLLQ